MPVWIIAKHFLLRNILDQRFFVALGLVLAFCMIGSFLSIDQHRDRLEDYGELRSLAQSEANLESVKLVRRPPAFSFLADAQEDRLPRYLVVTRDFVDVPVEDVSRRPLVEPFLRLDWIFAVVYFYSLLSIMLTYDWVSGQREANLLSTLLSYSVSRAELLIGGYLGALLTLLPCLLAGLVIYLLPAYVDGIWRPDGESTLQVATTLGLSVIFISSMAFIGLLASVTFKRSSVSLVFAFLAWATLTVVLPSGVELAVRSFIEAPSFTELQTRIRSAQVVMFSQYGSLSNFDILDIVRQPGLSRSQKEQQVAEFQAAIQKKNDDAIRDYKRALRLLRNDYLARHHRRDQIKERLLVLSPSSLFSQSVEALLGVGRIQMRHFKAQVERYMHDYTAFSNDLRQELEDQADRRGDFMTESGFKVAWTTWRDFSRVSFDRSAMPRFQYLRGDALAGLGQALTSCLLLLVVNGLLFLTTLQIFVRYSITS